MARKKINFHVDELNEGSCLLVEFSDEKWVVVNESGKIKVFVVDKVKKGEEYD